MKKLKNIPRIKCFESNVNLVTGYRIENRIIDGNGRPYPQSHRDDKAGKGIFNDIRKLNGNNLILDE